MAQLLLRLAAAALLVFLAATAADAGRGSPAPSAAPAPLAARLRAFFVSLADEAGGGGGGFAECWDALSRLGSCTSEIVIFFVSGESYIGPECCAAIRGATRHCWPSTLAAAGFTAEEADVLRGFCDAEAAANDSNSSPHPAGPGPVPVPVPAPAGKPPLLV